MPSKAHAQRLQEILDNIDAAARRFIQGMDLEAFRGDRKSIYAVTRALEIVSEASRRLPEALKSRHPDIPWRAIAAAGNVFRHEYEEVEPAVLWRTVTGDLQQLEHAVREELACSKASRTSSRKEDRCA